MSNWVDDNLDLAHFPKVDGASDATGTVEDTDMNAIRQALLDLKDSILGPSVTNAAGVIIAPGAPCYVSAANSILRSKADASATAECDGLAMAQFAIGGTGRLRARGDMPLTTAQWDAVTGQTGGLTPGAVYYVDPATAAKLTATAPTTATQFDTRVGRAVSTTLMRLGLQPPIGL